MYFSKLIEAPICDAQHARREITELETSAFWFSQTPAAQRNPHQPHGFFHPEDSAGER